MREIDRAEKIRLRAEAIYQDRLSMAVGGRATPNHHALIERSWEQAREEQDKFDALESEEREAAQ